MRLTFWKRARIAATIVVACYAAALAALSPRGFPVSAHTGRIIPYLADKPLQEDAFYMLTVAWYAGAGRGLSYNDGQPTVGIQPLNTVLDAAFARMVQAAGGDRWTLARFVLIVGLVEFLIFSWAAGALAARLCSDRRWAGTARDAAATLALLDLGLFRQFTNGLETGLYTLLVATVVWLWIRGSTHTSRLTVAAIGIASGLAVLARVDFLVVLLAALACGVALTEIPIVDAALVACIAALVASPWFWHVHRLTGHWIPSSGRAQAGVSTMGALGSRVEAMALAVLQQAAPWIHVEALRIAATTRLPPSTGSLVLAGAALVLAIAGITLCYSGAREVEDSDRRLLIPWAAGFAALFVVYPIFFYAAYFYPRYATPFVVLALPLIAIGVSRVPTRYAVAGVVLMAAASVTTARATLHNGELGNVNVLSAGYVTDAVPRTAVVGAFQSGVLGYFNEHVVNLDGKINADALAAAAEARLPQYVDARRIDYLVDWPGILAILPRLYLQGQWNPCARPTPDPMVECLVRR